MRNTIEITEGQLGAIPTNEDAALIEANIRHNIAGFKSYCGDVPVKLSIPVGTDKQITLPEISLIKLCAHKGLIRARLQELLSNQEGIGVMDKFGDSRINQIFVESPGKSYEKRIEADIGHFGDGGVFLLEQKEYFNNDLIRSVGWAVSTDGGSEKRFDEMALAKLRDSVGNLSKCVDLLKYGNIEDATFVKHIYSIFKGFLKYAILKDGEGSKTYFGYLAACKTLWDVACKERLGKTISVPGLHDYVA